MHELVVLTEQLLASVPGGTGRYTYELASALAASAPPDWRVTGVVAKHRDPRAAIIPGVEGPKMLPVPRRGCAAVLLVALVVHLSVLNQAPASAYFADTLAAWEQGRFIRFNGLAQWLGWLWPFATLVYVLLRASRREAPPTIAA